LLVATVQRQTKAAAVVVRVELVATVPLEVRVVLVVLDFLQALLVLQLLAVVAVVVVGVARLQMVAVLVRLNQTVQMELLALLTLAVVAVVVHPMAVLVVLAEKVSLSFVIAPIWPKVEASQAARLPHQVRTRFIRSTTREVW
jgi:hypothetical protein